jgi:DNA polymerase III subunit delta
MAKLKAHEVDGYLARPLAHRIVLIYGPDRGLVSERAKAVAAATKVPLDDPFSVVKLEASLIQADPARLADEALTVSMFGGDRLVWIKDAGNEKGLVDALKPLTAIPLESATILIEADDLKPASGLRSLCENAAAAMALPCYADDSRAVDTLIDRELAAASLTISLDARNLLKSSLGGDRLASRSEIEKLVLYCRGQKRVEIADVEDAIGDVSSTTADELVDAMLGGDVRAFDAAFSSMTAKGPGVQGLLAIVTRQVSNLAEQRFGMDRDGKTAAAAVAAARPPVFFTRKAVVERILASTPAPRFLGYLERIQDAVLQSRKEADLATAIIHRLLMGITLEQARTRNQTRN